VAWAFGGDVELGLQDRLEWSQARGTGARVPQVRVER
jgi:hypothetical protein